MPIQAETALFRSFFILRTIFSVRNHFFARPDVVGKMVSYKLLLDAAMTSLQYTYESWVDKEKVSRSVIGRH